MADGLSGAEKPAIAAYIPGTKLPPVAGDIDPNSIWGPSAANMPLDAPKCETPAPPIKLNAAAWNGWSPTSRNARYQEKPGLKAADVSRLKLKWAFNYPGAKNGQATIVGDWLFTTSMSGAVYAPDAKTRRVRLRHEPEAPPPSRPPTRPKPPPVPASPSSPYRPDRRPATRCSSPTGPRRPSRSTRGPASSSGRPRSTTPPACR